MPTATAPNTSPAAVITWRMRGLAVLGGWVYAFSHPWAWPGSQEDVAASLTRPAWALSFVALVPILWTVRNLSPRRAYFFSAWMLIPGTFTLLYWLMIAMNVFGGIPKILSVVLLLLLSAVGWNFMGVAVGVSRYLETAWAWPAWAAVPVSWAGMELCRAYVYFGGFPWGNLGTAVWNNAPLAQLGSVGGVYLILALLALCNVAIFELLRAWAGEREFPGRVVGAALAAVMVAWAYGEWRIVELDAQAAAAPKVRVGLLQGNIEQGIINQEWQHQDFIVSKYARLQHEAVGNGAQLVIWPEGALPAHLPKTPVSLGDYSFPPLEGASGIIGTGVSWRDPPLLKGAECKKSPQPADCQSRSYQHNSAVVVNAQSLVLGRFDKTHLVPFGEYVPWPLDAAVSAIVPGLVGYVPGDSLNPVAVPLPTGPHLMGTLICYEGVFPQYARQYVAAGAQLLVNITNDAWYGISSAAPQHLAFYAMRAAENGRAVARVANTGITVGIDPVGRLLQPTALYQDVALVLDLPLMSGRSLYNVTGDVFGVACAGVYLAALAHGLRGVYRARRKK